MLQQGQAGTIISRVDKPREDDIGCMHLIKANLLPTIQGTRSGQGHRAASSRDWQVGSNIRGVGAKTGKGGREVEDMAPHYLCLWTSSNFTARAIERTSLRPRRDKGGASARRNKTENGHAFSPSSQI